MGRSGLVRSCGQDGRQFEEIRHVGQRQNVVLELVWREVLYQRNQTCLVVDQQNYGVVFVQAVVSGVSHDGILFRNGEWLSFQRVARLMSI